MRCRVSGPKPVVSVGSLRSRALIALLLLPLAGCASNAPRDARATHMGVAGPPQQVAAAPIELEDDGLPTQTPPRMRRQRFADDPSEPFSPNYGRSPTMHDAIGNDALDNEAIGNDAGEGSQIESAPRRKAKSNTATGDAHAALVMPTPTLPDNVPAAFNARLVAALAKYE